MQRTGRTCDLNQKPEETETGKKQEIHDQASNLAFKKRGPLCSRQKQKNILFVNFLANRKNSTLSEQTK